ncbi:MAG: c-type cytochrome [Bacteroidetes bacterium]|nr:c-type cytochrome [Bacteroidota bacterium]MBS1641877.1 c-type cytochrome [Bacteroidota bacterium]MBS1670678.1 c-type cytochrome [Bacteroidota bacterium]
MKKIFILLAAFAMYACGNNSTGAKKDDAAKPATDNAAPTASADPSDNPDYQKGLELVAKNDCLTCHKVEEKLIGPPYKDVANKYTDKDVAHLAEKIIKGGSGVWGTVAMTPHAAVSQADAEQMVKYILLLKK